MIKLYFKKILVTLGFIANYVLLVFILAFVLHLVFRYMFSEIVRTFIIAIVALILNFVIVCKKRCRNLYHETEMIQISFWKNFIRIFKSKDSILHAFAFLTIALPFLVSIGVAVKTPVLPLVVGTIILFFVCGNVFLSYMEKPAEVTK